MPEVEDGIKLLKTKKIVAVFDNESGVVRTYFIDKNARELQTQNNTLIYIYSSDVHVQVLLPARIVYFEYCTKVTEDQNDNRELQTRPNWRSRGADGSPRTRRHVLLQVHKMLCYPNPMETKRSERDQSHFTQHYQ